MNNYFNYSYIFGQFYTFSHLKRPFCITRDKNYAISIMKLTKEWINTQTRPKEFQFKHTPSPCITQVKAGNKIRQS